MRAQLPQDGSAPAIFSGLQRVDSPEQAAEADRFRGPFDHRGLRVLGVDECLARLRAAPVGRLAFIHDGEPVILPVNHRLDGTGIVFRTTWGSKLLSVEHGGPVAYEVDGIDEARQTGWSVVVKGIASMVYEEVDAARLEELGLRSWAEPAEDAVWVRIMAEDISGREIARD